MLGGAVVLEARGLGLPCVEAELAVLFLPLPAAAWSRRGIQQECTVRASLDTQATCTIWLGS